MKVLVDLSYSTCIPCSNLVGFPMTTGMESARFIPRSFFIATTEKERKEKKKMSAAVARTEGAAAGAEEEFLVPFMAGSKRKGRSKKC